MFLLSFLLTFLISTDAFAGYNPEPQTPPDEIRYAKEYYDQSYDKLVAISDALVKCKKYRNITSYYPVPEHKNFRPTLHQHFKVTAVKRVERLLKRRQTALEECIRCLFSRWEILVAKGFFNQTVPLTVIGY